MKKQNKKIPVVLGLALCLLIGAGAGYMLWDAYRLEKENRQLDEQFAKELEESQKTIEQLNEQKAELETDIRKAEEKKNSGSGEESQTAQEPEGPTPSPTPEPLLVSILDREPGEVLPKEELYLDNPGIYFTASPIIEGEEIHQRIDGMVPGGVDSGACAQLRYLKMPYYQQNGEIHVGEMVVPSMLSQEVLDTFLDLFQKKQSFPSMELKDNLWLEETDLTNITEKYLSKE